MRTKEEHAEKQKQQQQRQQQTVDYARMVREQEEKQVTRRLDEYVLNADDSRAVETKDMLNLDRKRIRDEAVKFNGGVDIVVEAVREDESVEIGANVKDEAWSAVRADNANTCSNNNSNSVSNSDNDSSISNSNSNSNNNSNSNTQESVRGKRQRSSTSSNSQSPASALSASRSSCPGILKPGITFFGEALGSHVFEAMEEDKAVADLVIVIGTSMKVLPMSALPKTLPRTAPLLLVNKESVQLKADVAGEFHHRLR